MQLGRGEGRGTSLKNTSDRTCLFVLQQKKNSVCYSHHLEEEEKVKYYEQLMPEPCMAMSSLLVDLTDPNGGLDGWLPDPTFLQF